MFESRLDPGHTRCFENISGDFPKDIVQRCLGPKSFLVRFEASDETLVQFEQASVPHVSASEHE